MLLKVFGLALLARNFRVGWGGGQAWLRSAVVDLLEVGCVSCRQLECGEWRCGVGEVFFFCGGRRRAVDL